MIAALRTVAPGLGGAALAMLPNAGPGVIEIVLPRLINELAELPEPVVLVLDDYHLISDELVHASVAFLLAHLPRHAAAGAREPCRSAAVARRSAADELVEVRAEELRFDDDAAAALLNGSLSLELAAADVGLLQERTEGWPAGLQLAALSLRGREDRGAFIRAFAGHDRQIGDYLHEVIEDAPRPVREFLVRTSILERMCPPLCDALTGAGDGAALLAEAYRSNLFLVALDEQGHWYRYHHLFRDLLRRELAHRESGLVADLHARAAAWHRDNGNVEEAIMHAIAAGQVREASELIARHWQRAWDANPRTAARWLDALPPGAVEQYSRLSMARGWAALFMGPLDAVEPAVRAAEVSPFQGPDVAVLGTLEAQAALLRAALAYLQGDLGRAQEMAERALGDDATPPGRALAGLFGGVARFFRGDRDGAVESLERTRRRACRPRVGPGAADDAERARHRQPRIRGHRRRSSAVAGARAADRGVRPRRSADGLSPPLRRRHAAGSGG